MGMLPCTAQDIVVETIAIRQQGTAFIPVSDDNEIRGWPMSLEFEAAELRFQQHSTRYIAVWKGAPEQWDQPIDLWLLQATHQYLEALGLLDESISAQEDHVLSPRSECYLAIGADHGLRT